MTSLSPRQNFDWVTLILVFVALCIVFFVSICSCNEPKETPQNTYNCPCVVLTSSEEYLLVRDTSDEYVRIYDVVMVDKYKVKDIIK